ncbi:MAG: type III secretion system inner membrane ring subunit SctD [Acetobacteraceae bacterium]
MADDVTSVVSGRRTTGARPLLHVVSGPNQGAEAPLDDGAWIIGAGAGADLTFAEPALAETHLRIVVAGGKCRIVAMADGVRLGNEALPVGAERDLAALRPVAIGDTVFAIGPAGSDWSAVAQAAPAPAAVLDPALAPAVPGPATEAQPAAPAPDPVADVQVAASDRLSVVPPRRARLVLPVVALAVVVLAVAGLAWLVSGRPPEAPAQAPDPLQQARAVLAELHLDDLATSLVKGRVVISGYAATDEQVARLVETLKRQGVDADTQVMSQTALLDMVTTVLKAFGIDGAVQADGPGRIILTGYAEDGTRVDALLQRLKTDVAGLRGTTNRIVTPERARTSLEQAIAAANLSDVVKLTQMPRAIKAAGFLDRPRAARWAAVEERFRKEFGDRIRLETQFVTVAAATPRGVRLGKDPFVILDDGSRVGIGDMLGGAGRIVAIDAAKVRVRTASGDVDLPYAQTPNWILEDKP